MQRMGGSASSTATDLGFELTQAAQDAQFGVQGVANQIPLMAEQFQRLRGQTGSTAGALSSLATTFTGPTGLLAAGTLAVQFLPQLMQAFGDTGDSAKEAQEKIDNLADAASDVVDVTSTDTEELELQYQDITTAIDESSRRLRALQEIQQELGPTGLVTNFENLSPLAQQVLRDLQAQSDSLTLSEQTLTQQIQDEKAIRQSLQEQETELDRQLRLQERLRELGAERAEEEEDNAQALSDQLRSIGRIQQVQTLGTQPAQANPGAGPGSSPGPNFTSFELSGSARELGRQMGDFEDQSKSAFSAVQLGAQAATSATNALTQSLARGESFARGLQGTFSQLLSQVGSSLLQKAITGGSALGLSGGPLAALGIGGGLLGGILGAFDQGGIVDTPLQVVGESGPELAALPQGTRVSTARETERMLSGAQTVNVVAEIRRLSNGDLGIAVDEAQKRSNLYQRRNG
jgi:hypothetical protein